MKHSIFLKLLFAMILAVVLVESITVTVVYRLTYDHTVNGYSGVIKKAAMTSANAFSYYDPYDINDCSLCDDTFDEACELLDIRYIYAIRPVIESRDEIYLSLGHGKGASDVYIKERYPGYISRGTLTDKQIEAFNGSVEGTIVHERNSYDDTLICYVPVTSYYDNKTGEHIEETVSLVCVEVPVDAMTKEFYSQFGAMATLIFVLSIIIIVIVILILYLRISVPIKRISNRMTSFFADRKEKFVPLPVKGHDELAVMSQSFNNMAEEIELYLKDAAELNRQKEQLKIARTIQSGLLPPDKFGNDKVTIEAYMLPAKFIGGDLYDYQQLSDGRIFVTVADVSGKGVTAALFMARAVTMLHLYAEAGLSPGRILSLYNNHLAEHNPNTMFITTFAGIYDPATGEFTYANAGHNDPYILSDSLITLNGEHGMASGIFGDEEYVEHCVKMKPGDTLIIFTDGVTEAKSVDEKLFGEERLEKVLSDGLGSSGAEIMTAVLDKLRSFTEGAEQNDDITILTMQINKTQKKTLHLPAKNEQIIEINKAIADLDVSEDMKFPLRLMSEEIFVNICSYAYPDKEGDADITIEISPDKVIMTFEDSGRPFDPRENMVDIDEYDADTTVGGLGRFITFSMADEYDYQYRDGRNILRIIKSIDPQA